MIIIITVTIVIIKLVRIIHVKICPRPIITIILLLFSIVISYSYITSIIVTDVITVL